jgi:fucose permease
MSAVRPRGGPAGLLKALTFLMFTMFAMTTDSVGVIIPQVIRQFGLGMTAAGSFQYATMAGISIAAIGLGFLADRFGRKSTIIAGLAVFGVSCLLFGVGRRFPTFVSLLFLGGLGIGVFKAGALALIGDLSKSTREHTATMNLLEGFFGVGAIIGPALVASLLRWGAGWQWLYVIASGICAVLIAGAAFARYPTAPPATRQRGQAGEVLGVLRDPYALGFAMAAMLYVGTETAVYVWAPTYLAGYQGSMAWLALYAVSIFFVLRALGRFLGAKLLARFHWSAVLLVSAAGVLACFLASSVFGRGIAAIALPLSGVFMSVIYPTLNSKGISCFEKSRHGGAAGVLLFFTCVSAVLSPLAMAALSDRMGDAKYSLYLATGMAAVLAAMALFNALARPTAARLAAREAEDYGPGDAAALGVLDA